MRPLVGARCPRALVRRGLAVASITALLVIGGLTAARAEACPGVHPLDDAARANRAAKAIVVYHLDDVRGNLTLPTAGQDGAVITWLSSRRRVIDGTGVVHRPAAGRRSVVVKLTAIARVNAAVSARTFFARVRPLPAKADLAGYLFSYFTGNNEQIYFGLSDGNDPLRWRQLNNDNPVITSDIGDKGLRDPFIIRSPEGDKFYQIATDLNISTKSGDPWDEAQRHGSRSIVVSESTDLVHWTAPRLEKISPDTAGDTWAPEAFYDRSVGAYVVFWASTLYSESDPDHTVGTYHKMMYATTRDFHTFSEPKVWHDPGYSVIDSTMIENAGTYYRFTKDERGNDPSTPCGKFIIEQKSATISGTAYDFVADCIGKGGLAAGEGPLVFKSNTENKWYLFVDEFGGRGYVPLESTDLASGIWTPSTNYRMPGNPRHGTVLPVTQQEYEQLLQAYPPAAGEATD